jgi:peptidoglycan/LPS O-acetylase OafA/YrhL
MGWSRSIFFLSGFLISGLLFSEITKTGSFSISRFLIRRGLKIYPAFYVFIAFSAIVYAKSAPLAAWCSEVFFLQSYRPHVWGHTWSLAVEEHFYLALPCLILLLHRKKLLNAIPWISLALLVVCLISRVETLDQNLLWFATHSRIDALFAGVALGYLYHFKRETFSRMSIPSLLPLGILFLLPTLMALQLIHPRALPWLLTSNLLGFSAIVLWAVPRKLFFPFPLESIGRYSYSIYLWHFPICAWWRHMPLTDHSMRGYPMSGIGFVGNLVSAIVVGIAAAILIERPVLKLRDRFFPSFNRQLRNVNGPPLADAALIVTLKARSATP